MPADEPDLRAPAAPFRASNARRDLRICIVAESSPTRVAMFCGSAAVPPRGAPCSWGVFRPVSGWGSRSSCGPHTRGGVFRRSGRESRSTGCGLHTRAVWRRSFRRRSGRRYSSLVHRGVPDTYPDVALHLRVPTSVGVFRGTGMTGATEYPWPPRLRGCPDHHRPVHGCGHTVPTPVGVFRPHRQCRSHRTGSSTSVGGVPWLNTQQMPISQWSPRVKVFLWTPLPRRASRRGPNSRGVFVFRSDTGRVDQHA
jgi:hypothetical protein